jgi:hypothetical protein
MGETITLISGFKYDSSYDYVKTFTTKAAQTAYFNSLRKHRIDDTGYVRDGDGSVVVNMNKDTMVAGGYDYLYWNNGNKDYYAFITHKEYVNHENTRCHFELDIFQTFMFDFTLKKSFVERKPCTIAELATFDEGLDYEDHQIVSDTTVYTRDVKFYAMWSDFKQHKIDVVEVGGSKAHVSHEMPSHPYRGRDA